MENEKWKKKNWTKWARYFTRTRIEMCPNKAAMKAIKNMVCDGDDDGVVVNIKNDKRCRWTEDFCTDFCHIVIFHPAGSF